LGCHARVAFPRGFTVEIHAFLKVNLGPNALCTADATFAIVQLLAHVHVGDTNSNHLKANFLLCARFIFSAIIFRFALGPRRFGSCVGRTHALVAIFRRFPVGRHTLGKSEFVGWPSGTCLRGQVAPFAIVQFAAGITIFNAHLPSRGLGASFIFGTILFGFAFGP